MQSFFFFFFFLKLYISILNYTIDYTLHPKLFESMFCTLNYDLCYTLHPNIKFALNFDRKIWYYKDPI